MEDQRLEEMWYQVHKNDPEFKKMEERCSNYHLEKLAGSASDQSRTMADSMAIQNDLIKKALCDCPFQPIYNSPLYQNHGFIPDCSQSSFDSMHQRDRLNDLLDKLKIQQAFMDGYMLGMDLAKGDDQTAQAYVNAMSWGYANGVVQGDVNKGDDQEK